MSYQLDFLNKMKRRLIKLRLIEFAFKALVRTFVSSAYYKKLFTIYKKFNNMKFRHISFPSQFSIISK